MIDESIKVLCIENNSNDETIFRELQYRGFETDFEFHQVEQMSDGLNYLDSEDVDVVLYDTGNMDSINYEDIYEIQCHSPEIPVIVIVDDEELTAPREGFSASSIHDFVSRKHLDGNYFIRSIQFAAEKKELLVKLNQSKNTERHLAYHDFLTNLPNRYLFLDRFDQAMIRSKRMKTKIALLFLDLDGLKRINDALGHSFGDNLLRAFAKRITKLVRKVDTVARIGGDEFAVILADLQEEIHATKIASKIIDSISKPFVVNEHELFLATNIGISFYPNDGVDLESLLRRADIAMYRAKSQGKNTIQLFHQSMDAKYFEDLTLENSLRQAVEKDQLVLHYQPQVNLDSGIVTGVEVLVRWNHPKFGLVPPNKFIPMAEETGMILEIEEWVIYHACKQLADWQKLGFANFKLGINLSAREFRRPDLEGMIKSVLLETHLPASCVYLEITESSMMKNVENSIKTLLKLKEIGIQISVDDFGTGYSSLNYLKQFPIDILKVDRIFVQGIPDDKNDVAISTAIVVLARSMGLKVIAEGVETAEQVVFLQSLQCDEMQGFYFSKPLPAVRLTELLQTRKRLQ